MNNITKFEDSIKDLDMLVPIQVESKASYQLNSGVWNSSQMTGTELIPANAPDSYKIFRRQYTEFLNRRAIIESLFYVAGGIDAQQYLDAMKEVENNIKKLREHYNYKSVSLFLIDRDNNPNVTNILFSDIYLCNHYLNNRYGINVDDVYSGKLPPRLKGTSIFDQEWYTSEEQFITNYPTPNNLKAEPPVIKGEIK